jgi:hypothetical protein
MQNIYYHTVVEKETPPPGENTNIAGGTEILKFPPPRRLNRSGLSLKQRQNIPSLGRESKLFSNMTAYGQER